VKRKVEQHNAGVIEQLVLDGECVGQFLAERA
jgi:hypothetical protein